MSTSPTAATPARPQTRAQAGSPPATRRARRREQTVAEIKALAWQQLSEQGTCGVNLRAIAREMGTTSSALYRYFASADELIGTLCADAYEAAADAVAAARDAVPGDDHDGRWLAICDGFRRWSLDNPADFALIYGTPVPGYRAPAQATGPAAARLLATALEAYAAATKAGAADPARTRFPADLAPGPLLEDLLSRRGLAGTSRLAPIILSAWASIRGYLTTEVFGSLHQLTADPARLYRAHIRTVMAGMGYDPATIPDPA